MTDTKHPEALRLAALYDADAWPGGLSLNAWAALRGTKMELDCILGLRHDWQPTGCGYFLWTDNTTSVPRPPENAPYYREERCWRCNQKRHVNHLPPNA